MADKSPGGYVNPNFKKTEKASEHYDLQELFELIIKGNIAAVSKAITLTESEKPEHLILASELIKKLLPYSGNSIRIGITGIPGAGKSTLIEKLGLDLIKDEHKKLAILTIDPSSSITKGSILGDKTRMENLSKEANVFIRPSPSSGYLGGIAKATKEAMVICEAAGYNHILIETVGVGQSEIETYYLVDVILLVLIPGGGDELQGIKRGIMEMADLILVNKAEGENAAKAKLSAKEIENALHYFPSNKYGNHTETRTISALENIGVNEINQWIEKFIDKSKSQTTFEQKRKDQNEYWLEEYILRFIKSKIRTDKNWMQKLEDAKHKISLNDSHVYELAKEIVNGIKITN